LKIKQIPSVALVTCPFVTYMAAKLYIEKYDREKDPGAQIITWLLA